MTLSCVTAITPLTMYGAMCERLPLLTVERDEWTRRMIRWHFSEATGSRFWLEQKSRLAFDPVRDIDSYDALELFGFFDKNLLRNVRVSDLVPRGFAAESRRIFETGGTTGPPCRIVDIKRSKYDVLAYSTMLEARGLADGDVLAMTPSGPHAYGYFVARLADTWHGNTFYVDFDPRWVKALVRDAGPVDDYVRHLVAQAEALLKSQSPSLLFTTSKLLLALAQYLPRTLASYGVRAVCTGGTSCTDEEECHLREEHLAGTVWIDTYGNTLVGHALQADAMSTRRRSYHLLPPLSYLRVVDPTDLHCEVPVGETGRVVTTTLFEDLFIPNLVERDCAERVGPHPWFPWDGVARVQPFVAVDSDELTEGVY